MGTITYPTDKTPGAILQDELCGDGVNIRMFTTDGEAAAVALAVDLSRVSPEWRAFLLKTYDLADDAARACVAVIVKHTGLNGRGARHVSIKVMGEEAGPYYTGGANSQLLSILSPLRPGAGSYAAQWRARVLGA